MPTDEARPELIVDRLHRALVRLTAGRLHEATGEQLADALDEAGLGDAPSYLAEEALKFVVWRWKQRCQEQMLADLAAWRPTNAELARPH